MAELLATNDNDVLVCGRSEAKLAAVRQRVPELRTLACDIGDRHERERLFEWAIGEAPSIDILINNAGIQRETDFTAGAPELTDGESEIAINLTASIELAAAFVPYFLKSERDCAVVNVTSGLAFVPVKTIPVYCATKAALHSFSMALRTQLTDTNVRVVELIPPLVDTGLHRSEEAQRQGKGRGIPPERVAEALVKALRKNRDQQAVGQARDLVFASRLAPRFFHRLLNRAVADKNSKRVRGQEGHEPRAARRAGET